MEALNVANNLVKMGLTTLQVQPKCYAFRFPPTLPGQIEDLVQRNVFPTFDRLAPAFTFAVLLGLARFLLHLFVFKVCGAFRFCCCFASAFSTT